MIKILQAIWSRISNFAFPDDYYSWQTFIYLGIFSFVMSWIARLIEPPIIIIENIIATGGWIFFALGIGWFLEDRKIRIFGISLAPWVMGAIVCIYFFGLVPWGDWSIALTVWPLVSAGIAAVPQFLNWELKPKVPDPPVRQKLILLTLIALLFSNWFRFYFLLQNWFEDYPSVLADDFSNSEFVYRLAAAPEVQAEGGALLVNAENEIRDSLNNTPWPYVERWLLNLDERLGNIEARSLEMLEGSEEQELWDLQARPRTLDDSYALDLLAVWLGPSSNRDGYYLQKTCIIHPLTVNQPAAPTAETVQASTSTQLAQVKCDLATPKKLGRPAPTTS